MKEGSIKSLATVMNVGVDGFVRWDQASARYSTLPMQSLSALKCYEDVVTISVQVSQCKSWLVGVLTWIGERGTQCGHCWMGEIWSGQPQLPIYSFSF